VNDTMNTSGTEIASARALILAFLTNSEDDQTADFAEQCLDALAKSDKLKHDAELSSSYGQIVECGHEFAKIYDFDDGEIIPLREEFEVNDELTWSKFEHLMDQTCGAQFDVRATSLFLAIINQIRVPADELDDLLDLAVWYASTRVISFVTVSGGWGAFYQLIAQSADSTPPQPPPPVPMESVEPRLDRLNDSITMSQFERTIQEVEMGSMVVLTDASPLIDSQKTLTNSIHSFSEEAAGRTSSISSSVFNDVIDAPGSEVSSDRLSASPIILTPPGTGTPVFISSQPESIDLENDSDSSFDASLINELIANQSGAPIGIDTGHETSESTEENGFNINRSDTVRTLKLVPSTSIPIRGAGGQSSSLTDDYSPRQEGHSVGDSADGIILRAQQEVTAEALSSRLSEHLAHGDESGGENEDEMEMPDQVASVAQANSAEFDRLHDSTVFSHDITAENISKQGYFLLAGAAVVGLAAVFLKNR